MKLVASAEGTLNAPGGWKRRLEDPLNTYYRYPIARQIVRGLLKTPITPNQVTLIQPFIAAVAGYLISFEDWRYLIAAALTFELRSILDCADGTLARAKNMSSPSGHAIDGIADWLGVVCLYTGIFFHFYLHPPPDGAWSGYLSVYGILAIALFQGAARSFASDYYKTKYVSIFERGRDETTDALRAKLLALRPGAPLFAHIEIFILRMGHLAFEHEWYDLKKANHALDEGHIRIMRSEESSPRTRMVAALWSISNGDAFLSMICISALIGHLWLGQLFFATFGVLWIATVIVYNVLFVRSFERRSKLAVAEGIDA